MCAVASDSVKVLPHCLLSLCTHSFPWAPVFSSQLGSFLTTCPRPLCAKREKKRKKKKALRPLMTASKSCNCVCTLATVKCAMEEGRSALLICAGAFFQNVFFFPSFIPLCALHGSRLRVGPFAQVCREACAFFLLTLCTRGPQARCDQ